MGGGRATEPFLLDFSCEYWHKLDVWHHFWIINPFLNSLTATKFLLLFFPHPKFVLQTWPSACTEMVHADSAAATLWSRKHIKDIPVVDAPVQAKVERAEVATFPHHFHHRLVVELRDVSQIQDTQVPQLQEATHKTVFRIWKNDAEQSRRGAVQSRQRAKYFNPTSKKSERNS